jgi:hypothetical protein
MDSRALSALSLAGCLISPGLSAAGPSSLRIQVNVCPGTGIDARQAAGALRAELDADGVVSTYEASDHEASDGTLSATIGCEASLSTVIRLQATASARESQRTIVLADAPASERLGVLALSASELVRSDWLGLVGAAADRESSVVKYPLEESPDKLASSKVVVAPAEPPLAKNERTPATAAAPVGRDSRAAAPNAPWTMAAGAEVRWFVDYGSAAFGAAAGTDHRAWRLRAEALFSSSQDTLGSAAVGSAAACVGYRLLDESIGPFSISSHPTVAAGVTWMRGTTTNVDVRVTPATGLYADVRLVTEARLTGVAPSPTLAAQVGRSTGFVARSGGRALGASGGFFIGMSLGARY